MIRLFATTDALIVQSQSGFVRLPENCSIDAMFTAANPFALLSAGIAAAQETATPQPADVRAPLQSQEVWAAGVTYLRSKSARMEEARETGGGNFYDRVYEAERPELFFKATPQRVVGSGGSVRIRSDSSWNVPEPELTLAINSAGRIFGFTIGNDMSSRDIEGQNPLYLTQAKVYAGSAALGPCLVVSEQLPPRDTQIAMTILRAGETVFEDSTGLDRMKRSLPSLAEYLYRDNSFPSGAYLMTGTGIVPPDSFTLRRGDEVRITIEAVGTLSNKVA